MKKHLNLFYTLSITIIFLLILGISLTTWYMIESIEEFNEFADNFRWEKTLEENHYFDDNLIVFFGDSQIALWWMCPYFGAMPIKNRGISGDWASKSINRFKRDVLDLNPSAVFILIGTNDLGYGESIKSITGSIEMMMKEANRHSIKVIIGSLLPVNGIYIADHPLQSILEINDSLSMICQKYNSVYVDFYSGFVNDKGYFKKKFTDDGLHPNQEGYHIMTRMLVPILMEHLD